ncbi:MAG: DNRLRE domain-containing protein [Caldilineaceae bacterium]
MNQTTAFSLSRPHTLWWRLLAAILLIGFAWHSARITAFAATPPPVTIPTNGDAYLVASQPTTNYGSGPLGVTPGAQALVSFDISGLPAASRILSAKLRLLPNDIIGAAPSTVNISRVDAAWDEATVTPTTAPTATPTGASALVSTYVIIEWDVTTTVREWHRGTSSNYGFMLTTVIPASISTPKRPAPRLS